MTDKLLDQLGIAERVDIRHRGIWVLVLFFTATIIFSTALVQIGAGLLIITWLALHAGTLQLIRTPLDLPFLAFFVVRLVTIPFAVDPAASAQGITTELVFYPVYFALRDAIRPEGRDVRILFGVIVAAATVASSIGIALYALGSTDRAASTTAGYYTLGLFLTAALPLALIGRSDGVRLLSIRTLPAVVIVVGILLTFDRLHWLIAGAQILVIGIVWNRRFLVAALAGGAAVVILFPAIQQRFVQLIQFQSHLSDRDVLLRGVAQLWLEHPMTGFGMRSFNAIFPLRGELADKLIGGWHNDFVQVYMESGALALVSFLWLFGATFLRGIRALRRASVSPERQRRIAALLLSLAVFLIPGGSLDVIGGQLFRLLLAILGGSIVAAEQVPPSFISNSTSADSGPPGTPPPP